VTQLRTDLPLTNNSSSYFIPWLIGVMVFLAILAVSGSATLNKTVDSWTNSVTGTITIQVPHVTEVTEVTEVNGLSSNIIRAKRIIREIKKDPNIVSARLLSKEEIEELLTPWIGNASINLLPFPQLIDVSLVNTSKQEEKKLKKLVHQLVPDAIIDNHRRWFENLVHLVKGFQVLTSSVASLITSALILTIVYATKSSIAEFSEVIRVLHIVGARDIYIATQFSKRAFLFSLKGSIAGLFIGSLTIIVIAFLSGRMQSDFVPNLYIGLDLALLLPTVAITSIAISVVTTFITVLSNLRSMV
jgi:cell division transport system permease protein